MNTTMQIFKILSNLESYNHKELLFMLKDGQIAKDRFGTFYVVANGGITIDNYDTSGEEWELISSERLSFDEFMKLDFADMYERG